MPHLPTRPGWLQGAYFPPLFGALHISQVQHRSWAGCERLGTDRERQAKVLRVFGWVRLYNKHQNRHRLPRCATIARTDSESGSGFLLMSATAGCRSMFAVRFAALGVFGLTCVGRLAQDDRCRVRHNQYPDEPSSNTPRTRSIGCQFSICIRTGRIGLSRSATAPKAHIMPRGPMWHTPHPPLQLIDFCVVVCVVTMLSLPELDCLAPCRSVTHKRQCTCAKPA
jgi:hypothetical protein